MKTNTSDIPHFRTFKAKYLPVTNNRPSRIRITDTHSPGNDKFPQIIRSWNHDIRSNTFDQAAPILQSLNISIAGFSYDSRTGECIIFTNDFATPLIENNTLGRFTTDATGNFIPA